MTVSRPVRPTSLGRYRRHQVRYAIAIVLPGGETNWYRLEFDPQEVSLVAGAEAAGPADVVHRITASALAGWIEHRKSFFYVRAYSRRFGTLYDLTAEGRQVRLNRRPLPDLLMHYLLNVMEGSEVAAKRQVDLAIEAIR